MAIVLGDNQYGKAETRVVRVDRDPDGHRVTDLNVTTTLAGDLADTHLTGDNANVLPTDTQKNTVYAFARDGIGEVEEFAIRLARHFVDSQPAIHRARVAIEQYAWDRIRVDGRPTHHSFSRSGSGTRTAKVTYDGEHTWVVSGISDLVVLNSTDSEFTGYVKDALTTLPETKDRVLATAVEAGWRHAGDATGDTAADTDWAASYDRARQDVLEAFADTYSRSLQQTLYAMGERVLANQPQIAEVRLSLPNKHHLPVDLAPFGLDNPGDVFHADDRPYGLIEGTVRRDDAQSADAAW
jgi:urate oxidase